MAFSDKQKRIISNFLVEMGQGDPRMLVPYVVNFIDKTKAEQKAEIVAWLNAKRAKLLADKESLPLGIAQQEAAIDADVADIDDLKGAL